MASYFFYIVSIFFTQLLYLPVALQAQSLNEEEFFKSVRKSIVKIKVESRVPKLQRPWETEKIGTSTGTGFYIGQGRFITNAHVIAHGTFISIQKDGDSKFVRAKALYVADDADLALLVVDQEHYTANLKALTFGTLPSLRSTVTTVGYPKGGDQISFTKGIVSRISYRRYVHSYHHKHILIQVDSAINSGNSGGPVFQNNEVIGVAFQSNTQAENTGYVIPAALVLRFLEDIKDSRYDGHVEQGLHGNTGFTSNPYFRMLHQMSELEEGFVISYLEPWSPAQGLLQENDILLTIDQLPIGTDGKVPLYNERISFFSIYDLKQVGDKATYTILRNGQRKTIEVPVKVNKKHYFSGHIYDQQPKYFMIAGLVFTPLNLSYLKSLNRNWSSRAPLPLKFAHFRGHLDQHLSEKEEVVVCSDRLPDGINSYLDHFRQKILMSVNHIDIKSLEHLDRVISESNSKDLIFEFAYEDDLVVLPRERALERTSYIAKKYDLKVIKNL